MNWKSIATTALVALAVVYLTNKVTALKSLVGS